MKQISHYHLGELEAEIMDIVWQRQLVSVRQVLQQLKKRRQIAYTTVMTVMSRLADKKLLRRQLQPDGAYQYAAVYDKEEFLTRTSKFVLHDLLKHCGDIAVAQFVDMIDQHKGKQATTWRKKLKSRKLL